jgi:hypothetical protein
MRVLTQRSQKDRTGWDRINRLVDQWLPKPRILHLWPNHRRRQTSKVDVAAVATVERAS